MRYDTPIMPKEILLINEDRVLTEEEMLEGCTPVIIEYSAIEQWISELHKKATMQRMHNIEKEIIQKVYWSVHNKGRNTPESVCLTRFTVAELITISSTYSVAARI